MKSIYKFVALMVVSMVHLLQKTLRFEWLYEDPALQHPENLKSMLVVNFHQYSFYGYFLLPHLKNCKPLVSNAVFNAKVIKEVLTLLKCECAQIPIDFKNLGDMTVFVELIKLARSGTNLGIAIDGPYGPRFEIKPGMFLLADKAKMKIVPIKIKARHKINIPWRWDKYEIPLPFSKVTVQIGAPIDPPAMGDVAAVERVKALLKSKMT